MSLVSRHMSALEAFSRGSEESQSNMLLRLIVFHLTNGFYLGERQAEVYSWLKQHGYLNPITRFVSNGDLAGKALTERLFWVAIDNRDLALLQAMIQAGYGVKGKHRADSLRYSVPLHAVCNRGNLAMARALVDAGADVNEVNSADKTPLDTYFSDTHHYGSSSLQQKFYDIDLVRFLLDAGATCNIESARNGIAGAAKMGDHQFVKLLLPVLMRFSPNDMCRTALKCALLIAVSYEDTIEVDEALLISETVLSAGIGLKLDLEEYLFTINNSDAKSKNLVYHATSRRSVALMKLLWRFGAKTHPEALEKAIEIGDSELINALINSDWVFPEVIDEPYRQMIETAVANLPFRETVRVLEDLQRKPACPLKLMSTAFNHALILGNEELIEYFKEKKVEFDMGRASESIKAAATEGNTRIFHLFFEDVIGYKLRYIGTDYLLALAITGGNEEIIAAVLEANDFRLYNLGIKSLRAALRSKNTRLFRTLLERTPEVNHSWMMSYELECRSTFSIMPGVVSLGDLQLIKEALNAGADINGLDFTYEEYHIKAYPESALTAAIKLDRYDLVEYLATLGADPNDLELRLQGQTALATAVESGSKAMMDFLISLGADPLDDTALFAAIHRQDEHLTEALLIHAKARRYWPRWFGGGPLLLALAKSNRQLVHLLLRYGVNPHERTRSRLSSHAGAKYAREIRASERRIIYHDAEMSPLGQAVLVDAESSKKLGQLDTSMTRLILEAGVDPNASVFEPVSAMGSWDPRSALSTAVVIENHGLVELLLSYGADANRPRAFGEGYTALQFAVEKGSLETIALLIRHGADVNAPPSINGSTALQMATNSGFFNIASLLIEHGADVNGPRAQVGYGPIGGVTAIEAAAQNGRFDFVRLLLQKGAILVGDGEEQYQRATKLAQDSGHLAVQELLEQHYTQQLLEQWMEI